LATVKKATIKIKEKKKTTKNKNLTNNWYKIQK
jgi:hypothetical protein